MKPQSLRTLCAPCLAAGIAAALLVPGFARHAAAADWPQWRHDANRSGATAQEGPAGPGLLWRIELDYPDPAYDHQYRMCADVAYAPVAGEGLLFVPSNVTDQVVAYSLQTGAAKWRFITEGAVRLAPVYHDGKVCFGSDDGYLYCVAARDGRLLWRVRGAAETLPDSRMLANGRMCSRWPVRGAPVVHGGVVYFGAGIWPEEGVYVCAVDAATGKVRWRVDSTSYVKGGMSDHGRPYDLSLPPQGYLAVIDGKLAVPSGRSLAAWFDLETGKMEPYTCFYSKLNPPRGTWYLAGINQYCVQGGNWFGTRADAAPALPADFKDAKSAVSWSRQTPENEQYVIKNRPFLNADVYVLHNENLYIEPVLTETTRYASEFTDERKYLVPRGHTHVKFPEFDRIVARDLTKPEWKILRGRHISYGTKGKVNMKRLVFPILWELKSPLRVLAKAGSRLYAGGKDSVAAIAIPKPGEAPRIAWQAKVDGTPVYALVADHKLVVAMRNGSVYCFGAGGNAQPATTGPKAGPYASPPKGYACVLGWGDGTRVRALAGKGGYRVVVFEPDGAKVASAREALTKAGLQGRQAQVIHGSPAHMRLTPYWASLVTVESLDAFGSPEATLSFALDALRPYTGKLLLANGRRHADLLKRILVGRTGYAMPLEGKSVTVQRHAPPEGYANWTHEAGGPENCFASSDKLVKWPLGVLWYSGDVDRFFTPASHFQHERHPYPLVIDGRMFIFTHQLIHAVDIYTGTYLWKAEMPVSPWLRTRSFDSRIYGRPTERNGAVAHDWLYAVAGDRIRAFDVATGKETKVFEIPASLRDQADLPAHRIEEKRYMGHKAKVQAAPRWTEVRLCNDLLIAMLGRTLAALDRHTGDVRWTRPSTRQTTTYAIGGGTLYGLDFDEPKMGGGEKGTVVGLLFAMDPAAGKARWQKPLEFPALPKHKVDHPRLWLRPVVPALAYNAKHRLLVMTVNRTNVHVFRASDGAPVWSKSSLPTRQLQRVYAPVVTDDYLLLSSYKGCFGYLLDVRTGKEAGEHTGIPRPRTCARVIGNNSLLVYRDAATELYDIEHNRMVGLNSVRSGCTTSFVPAGGVMAAPMLGHGCVCNYPMFASVGLYHWPEIDKYRPAAVRKSWVNQAKEFLATSEGAGAEWPFGQAAGKKIDVQKFRLINATAQAAGSALRLTVKDRKNGYAIRKADKPLERATFRVSLKRAAVSGRHGNGFLVAGSGEDPKDWIECRFYFGGRSSLMIAGGKAEQVEQKVTIPRRAVFTLTVSIDCAARTVTFEAVGQKVASKITGPLPAITHYGYGGGNADNYFTDIEVR